MAGLTSTGLGSGLDINSLVTQLVAAEKATQQKQITRAQASTVTTITALASLKGAMSTFNSALASLKTVEVFSSRSATSSDQKIFSASASNTAVPGTYDVDVVRLATAHQISSNSYAQGAAHVVGTGTLTIQVGSKSFSVGVDSTHNTLAQIRDAINQAADNADLVDATIVSGSGGSRLVLSAVATGASNAIQVAQSGGDGGLSSLVYNPSLTTNYTQLRAAQDAQVYVAGYLQTSATNSISGAIDGVTINLFEQAPGQVKKLTIANDTAAAVAKVKTFVDSFNALAKQITTLRSYEPTTKKAGPLLGDAMLRTIEGELRGRISDPVSGTTGVYQTLASVGITTEKDGTLKVNDAKLSAAMSANYDGVAQLFGSANGVAARLSAALTPRLASDAELDGRTKRLNAKSLELQKQQEVLEARMVKIEARYRAQFNNLDNLLSKMQNTSSYLTQQLAQIAKIGED